MSRNAKSLRHRVIRLAHGCPDLRADLLPLLKEAALPKWQVELLSELAYARVHQKIPKAEGDKIREQIVDAGTAAAGRKVLDKALTKYTGKKAAGPVRVFADLDEQGLTVWAEFTPYGRPHQVIAEINKAMAALNTYMKGTQSNWPTGVLWRDFGDMAVDVLPRRRGVMYFHASAQGRWDDLDQDQVVTALAPVSGWRPLPK